MMRADVGPARLGLEDLDGIRGVLRVLHLDDGVGALRHRRSGHDPDGLARPHRLHGHLAGRHVFDDREHHRLGDGMLLREVLAADREAIHRRVVPGWVVAWSDDVLAQHAAERFHEPDLLQAERMGRGEHDFLRLFEGGQSLHVNFEFLIVNF
jgi:hypothetical protein